MASGAGGGAGASTDAGDGVAAPAARDVHGVLLQVTAQQWAGLQKRVNGREAVVSAVLTLQCVLIIIIIIKAD